MNEVLLPLIGDIIIFAFELPVDNLVVPQFWIGLLARLDAFLVLLMEVFSGCLSMELIRKLGYVNNYS